MRERHRRLALVGSEIGGAEDVDFDFRRIVASGESAPDFGLSDPDPGHLVMVSSGTTQLPKASLWTVDYAGVAAISRSTSSVDTTRPCTVLTNERKRSCRSAAQVAMASSASTTP